ncbi:MAG TPA: ABC transporter permease [bacterium]|nr:ABC transporter permease [bacterium]
MFWKNLLQLFRDIRHQKLRTLLTLFGIIWGSVAIILLLTFGNSFYKFSKKAAHGMGEGICIMWGGRTSIPYEGFNRGRPIRLREDEVRIMQQQIPLLGMISPEYSRGVTIKVGKEGYSTELSGVYPIYREMRNMIAAEGGRFINPLDLQERRRVAFIGDVVETDLFGEGKGLGQIIFIDRVPFKIIGVLKPKMQSSSYTGRDNERIVIPATTFQGIFGHQYLSNMIYKAVDVRYTQQMIDRVYEVLGKRFKFHPDDREALAIWDTTEMEKFFDGFFAGFQIFLGIVGCMTLIVGGIGVSNIMNVVVEERTHEIGIKKALGAKRRLILGQYLMETLIITGIGGVIGFLISSGIVSVINMLDLEQYIGTLGISPLVTIVTITLLGMIGLIAGWFPARYAAYLDPVQAIRK